MQEITLTGTHSQMGHQHGEIMAQAGFQLPEFPPALKKLAEQCVPFVQEYTPALHDEMEAFACAARLNPSDFQTMMLALPLQQTLPSCSVVAILPDYTDKGSLLIGRNYDYGYAVSWDSAALYHTRPSIGHAHSGCADIFIGREDGVNVTGLYTAMSATFLPGVQPGIPFWFIIRHILETCTTVQEALAWIRSIPHSQSRNYMLADEKEALVVETSIEGIHVREPEDGVLVMTNHPVHPALAGSEVFKPEDSIIRYDRLRSLVSESVSVNILKTALNDRANHVCAHGEIFSQPYGTIWSEIVEPASRSLAIARGTGDNSGMMNYRSVSI